MWSVGVILAELLGGKPFFKGRECVVVFTLTKLSDPVICVCSDFDQCNDMLHYLGTPSDETLRRIGSPGVGSHVVERMISSSDRNFKGSTLHSIATNHTRNTVLNIIPPCESSGNRFSLPFVMFRSSQEDHGRTGTGSSIFPGMVQSP